MQTPPDTPPPAPDLLTDRPPLSFSRRPPAEPLIVIVDAIDGVGIAGQVKNNTESAANFIESLGPGQVSDYRFALHSCR